MELSKATEIYLSKHYKIEREIVRIATWSELLTIRQNASMLSISIAMAKDKARRYGLKYKRVHGGRTVKDLWKKIKEPK